MQGIERIDSDTRELVGRITYDLRNQWWERKTITFPFGARVVVEHAAQHLRFSDPAVSAWLMAHAQGIHNLSTQEKVREVSAMITSTGSNTVKRTAKQVAFDFFYAHAGSSYTPGKETPEQGRARGARQLAQAEARASAEGYTFEWLDDVQGCSGCDCGNEECVCFSGEGHEVLGCIARDADGEDKASLWGICGATREYRRVVEAELALEALSA